MTLRFLCPRKGGTFINPDLPTPYCQSFPYPIDGQAEALHKSDSLLLLAWLLTLDAAWLMGRRFSDRSLCSTSAGSDDQSLWKYPGLRSPTGAFVFPTFGTKQHSYPMCHFSCLPHTLACSLYPLSTIFTNCKKGFWGEKNQPA